MGSNAIPAFGTKLKRGDGGTPETFTDVAEVTDLSGPEMSAEEADVTTHATGSASPWREIIPTLLDAGEVSLSLSFLPGTAGHKALLSDFLNRVKRNWQIVFPDAGATTWSFSAYVMNISPAEPIDDALTAEMTLRVTGAPTIPTA
jgi:predicted secreted protein